MKSIYFDTGIWREYAVNGDESNTIRVNIADPNLEKRLNETDAAAKEWFERLKTDNSPEIMFEADEALRIMLDNVFNSPISAKAFGNTNIFTPVGEDGEFLFTAFCNAFGKALEEDAKAYAQAHKPQPAAPSPHIRKYLPDGSVAFAKPLDAQVPDISGFTQEQKQALLRQLLA